MKTKLHYQLPFVRIFKVSFLGPTNYKGSRVKIRETKIKEF